jgi:hypothetical protein
MTSWILVALLFPFCLFGQQVSDWRSLSRLQPGDQVKVSLKSGGTLTGEFRSWSDEGLAVGLTNANRPDVTRLERYRKGVWSLKKRVAVAGLIGAAGGVVFGVVVGGCKPNGFGPCFSRAETGAAGAGAGFVLGAIIGAVIPRHKTEVIFALK